MAIFVPARKTDGSYCGPLSSYFGDWQGRVCLIQPSTLQHTFGDSLGSLWTSQTTVHYLIRAQLKKGGHQTCFLALTLPQARRGVVDILEAAGKGLKSLQQEPSRGTEIVPC